MSGDRVEVAGRESEQRMVEQMLKMYWVEEVFQVVLSPLSVVEHDVDAGRWLPHERAAAVETFPRPVENYAVGSATSLAVMLALATAVVKEETRFGSKAN
jgi:hypothetical protein